MKSTSSLRKSERGEGQIQSLVMLFVLILLAVGLFRAGPVWWTNYQFEDELTAIAGKFPPNPDGDKRAMVAVGKAIRDAGLNPYMDESNCSVTSGGGIGGLRTVTCTYTREYDLLPGMAKRSKTFEISVSRPMF